MQKLKIKVKKAVGKDSKPEVEKDNKAEPEEGSGSEKDPFLKSSNPMAGNEKEDVRSGDKPNFFQKSSK